MRRDNIAILKHCEQLCIVTSDYYMDDHDSACKEDDQLRCVCKQPMEEDDTCMNVLITLLNSLNSATLHRTYTHQYIILAEYKVQRIVT